MLTGQNFGWGHESRLCTGLYRAQHRQQGHHGFPRTDIALKQAQHGDGRSKVGVDLGKRTRLRTCQMVTEPFQGFGAKRSVSYQCSPGS